MFLSLLHVNVANDAGRNWLGDVYRVHQRLWMAFPDNEGRAADPFFLGAWDGPALADPKPQRRAAGFLFRIERDGRARILVQSAERPDWKYAFQNAPYLLAKDKGPQVHEIDPAPRIEHNYRFRLLANVVKPKSVVHPSGKMRMTRGGVSIAVRKRTEVPIFPIQLPEILPVDRSEREQLLHARWEPWRNWLQAIGADRGFGVIDDRAAPLLMQGVHLFVRKKTGRGHEANQKQSIDRRFNAGLFEGLLVCTDQDRLRSAIIDGVGHSKAFGFGLLSIAPAAASS